MENDEKSESQQSNKTTAKGFESGCEASRSTKELRKLFALQKTTYQLAEDKLEQWLSGTSSRYEPDNFDDSEKRIVSQKKQKWVGSLSQIDLIKLAVSGDKQAWNELIAYFSTSLRKMARQRTDRDHVDLYQEGAIGLINAIKKFCSTGCRKRSARFYSFALDSMEITRPLLKVSECASI